MKLFRIPLVIAVATLTAGVAKSAPCASSNCSANQKSAAENVRHYSAIGVKSSGRRAFNKPPKGWFAAEWGKTMAEIVNDPKTCAFENHYPALVARVYWSEAYIDDRIKPTRSQARDPSWSNYVWNQKQSDTNYVFDGISDALNDTLVDNGQGIAKLSITVGLTATSGSLIPPEWMRKDKALTWVEGTNSNGNSSNWHVRFDNPEAVDHAADFLAAFLAKFGNNKGVHSVNIGEYYLGQREYIPSGLDRDKYGIGLKNLWGKVVSSAPRDKDGKRVNIVQTNPMFSTGVTINDMETLGIGISESDTNISFPVSENKVTSAMRQLYDNNKVHVMINGDERYACQGRRQTWDGTPNPFGHAKGYSGVATPQETFWYHGEDGPAPTHSLFMAVVNWCSGPQNRQNFIDAVNKFGRCGSETSKWGVTPSLFSGSDTTPSIYASKPNPPIVVVN